MVNHGSRLLCRSLFSGKNEKAKRNSAKINVYIWVKQVFVLSLKTYFVVKLKKKGKQLIGNIYIPPDFDHRTDGL